MSDSNVAIVTGYASGLGYALAKDLLSRGWNIIGVSRKHSPTELHMKYNTTLTRVQGSVDQQDTVNNAFAAANAIGELKLLINCAGAGVFGEVGSYNAADIKEAIAGNLAGLMLFSDTAVREMRQRGGDIVNVMSTAGKKLRTAEAVYCATKWGAKAYTRTIRDAIKADKLPIRVFEVYPCGMNTPFWAEAIRPASDGKSYPNPEYIASRILDEVLIAGPAYCQELTFERS